MGGRFFSTKASAIRTLLREGSIPSHTCGDTLAILANCASSASVTSDESDALSMYLNERILGMGTYQAFQVLGILARHRGPISRKISLDHLRESYISNPLESSMSPSQFVRGLEYLAELHGNSWDPVSLLRDHRKLKQWLLTSSGPDELLGLVKLGVLRDTPVQTILGAVGKSRMRNRTYFATFFHLGPSIVDSIPIPSTISIHDVPDLVGGWAAWDREILRDVVDGLLENGNFAQLSPHGVQRLLWCLTAQGIHSRVWNSLLAVANRCPWEKLYMKEQTLMSMDPDYLPPYPLRFPHMGSGRIHGVVSRLYTELGELLGPRNLVQNSTVAGRYRVDLAVNGRHFQNVVPYTSDPLYRVFKKHFRRLVPGVQEVAPCASAEHVISGIAS
jgi:hypothetical protein